MSDGELIERAETLVTNAKGGNVSVSRLTGGKNKLLESSSEQSNEPIISYLFEEEQPHYIFTLKTASSVTIEGDSEETEVAPKEGFSLAGWFVSTDLRVILIVNAPDEDDVLSIPYGCIEEIGSKNKLFGGADLSINTNNYKYVFSTPRSIPDGTMDYIRNEAGKSQPDLEEQHLISRRETILVCKKCKQEISENASKCPHCGYYPGKGGKGRLWHGTALATAWNPIGQAMLAKGAADELRSNRGIGEEKSVIADSEEPKSNNSENPLDKLERLNELKDEGVITKKEFQQKKRELLEEI